MTFPAPALYPASNLYPTGAEGVFPAQTLFPSSGLYLVTVTPPPQGGLGQSWFVLDFEAAYAGEPAPVQEQTRAGGAGGFEYGPIGARFIARIPLGVSFVAPVEARIPVESNLVKLIGARLPVSFSTVRQVQIRTSISRQPAGVYLSRLREDEEILIALLIS